MVVDAGIDRVFAILYDDEHQAQWVYRTETFEIVERRGRDAFILYTLIQSPVFFVSDREAIFATTIQWKPSLGEVSLEFQKSDLADTLPPTPGYVRVPFASGRWRLRKLAEARTHVFFESVVDPGGWLPHWLVNLASQDPPLVTLRNLREQLNRGIYKGAHQKVLKLYPWQELHHFSPRAVPPP